MKRWDVINHLISKYGYKRYLEIGVQDYTSNCAKINAEYKVAVDPAPRNQCDFIGTSDEFFAQNKEQFDIIFIDGLHHSEQVDKDIVNSLACLSEGGTIVMHDCNPTTEVMQRTPDHGGEWTGDVWKSVYKIRQRPDLFVQVVNTDYGCGIVQRGEQEVIDFGDVELTYEFLDNNRGKILNLVDPNQWK